jgi:hypothetical protein
MVQLAPAAIACLWQVLVATQSAESMVMALMPILIVSSVGFVRVTVPPAVPADS